MVQISQLNISMDIMLIIVIRPLCIKRPQIIGYVKCFDSNKTMSFKALIKNRWNVILKYGENSAI